MIVVVLWDVRSCIFVCGYHFGSIYCLHLQGGRVDASTLMVVGACCCETLTPNYRTTQYYTTDKWLQCNRIPTEGQARSGQVFEVRKRSLKITVSDLNFL